MDLILHYDEELDLEFEIPEFDPEEYRSLTDLLDANTEEVNEAIMSALHTGIELQLDWVPAFTIRGALGVVTIPKSEYGYQIQRLLKYYSELEEYELCVVLKELESQL